MENQNNFNEELDALGTTSSILDYQNALKNMPPNAPNREILTAFLAGLTRDQKPLETI